MNTWQLSLLAPAAGAVATGYVSGQARDAQGPGYAWEIHTYAEPGNSEH